jgi:hypothetical protein
VTRPRLIAEPLPDLVDTGSAWLRSFAGSGRSRERRQVVAVPATVPIRSHDVWATIYTASGAGSSSISAADTLASEIGRIWGSTPQRASSSSSSGLRVGLVAEWGQDLGSSDWALMTLGGIPYVLGRTSRGLQTAIRRVLHLLGYRRLTTVAERIPQLASTILLPDEQRTLPLRSARNIATILANPDQGQTRLVAWTAQNVPPDDGLLASGHSWAAIVAANLPIFLAHPEYTGGGQTGNAAKLACYDPAVQALARTYTLAQFAGGGRIGSSLSASDGGGWTLATGTGEEVSHTATDRVLRLANSVQPWLGPDQHVVVLAYSDASLPPVTESVGTGIVVMPTTSFIHGGQTWDEVVDAFEAAGGQLFGMYDYLSNWLRNQDQPQDDRASSQSWVTQATARLARCIALDAEDYAAWACCGRARYALAGWLVGDDPAARWAEYPASMFPTAPVQRAAWFSLLETPVPFSSDLVHRLCQAALDLISATSSSTVAGEHESALDTGRYALYCALLRTWSSSQATTDFEALLRHCWLERHRDQWCFEGPYQLSTWATPRKAVAALHSLSDLTDTSGTALWGSTPQSEATLVGALTAAVAANALILFPVVGFSDDYVRVSGLTSTRPRGTFGTTVEINRSVQFLLQGSGTVHVVVNGGVVRQDLGPDHVRVYDQASSTTLLDVDVSETGPDQSYDLVLDPALIYLVDVTSAGGCDVTVAVGTGFAHVFDPNEAPFHSSCNAYVYIPKRTGPYAAPGDTFGFFVHGGTVGAFDKNGTRLFGPTTANESYFSFQIPAGVDGTAIEITGATGAWSPLTTPPGASLAPGELFVPREVALADGLPFSG